MDNDLNTRIEATLEELRPYLKTDGGDIKLVEITEDLIVRVELMGSCADCSMIQMTLKGGGIGHQEGRARGEGCGSRQPRRLSSSSNIAC